MPLPRSFNIFHKLYRISGYNSFCYPSDNYRISKKGILAFLFNISLTFMMLYGLKNRLPDNLKIDSLFMILSLLMTISFFTFRFIIYLLSFIQQKHVFFLLKKLEDFDRELIENNIKININHLNLCWPFLSLVMKAIAFMFSRNSLNPLTTMMFLTFQLPIEFFFLAILLIFNKIDIIQDMLR